MLTRRVIDPLVPVTTTVYVPGAPEQTRLEVAVGLTAVKVMKQDSPVGEEEPERKTVPEKKLTLPIVIVEVPAVALPRKLRLVGLAYIVNS
jgi:hypothetical protein